MCGGWAVAIAARCSLGAAAVELGAVWVRVSMAAFNGGDRDAGGGAMEIPH